MTESPRWMSWALYLAGAYNLAWGGWVVLFPQHSFSVSGMRRPDVALNYAQLWQCIGMIVGVYGVGYIAAGRDPARHWPVVLVGALGKVFGPIGFAHAALTGQLEWSAGVTILFNDLIWWVPFALILRHAWRSRHVT